MITLVVSGFQSGSDIGGIRAAYSLGIPTGGFMPKGSKTEFGPHPEYARLYGARQHESPNYQPRTLENVRLAQSTLWFGDGDSRGYGCTVKAARQLHRPFFNVTNREAESIAALIRAFSWTTINVAGNRESINLGIEESTRAILDRAFRIVNEIGETRGNR